MHTAEGQCVQEGLQISINMVLALSVFAGNALTTVGTGTPYQAVYGRQPLMLPPLEGEAVHTGDSNEGHVEARVREITIASMVQASPMARVSRTLKSKTSALTVGKCKPGDLVNILKPG